MNTTEDQEPKVRSQHPRGVRYWPLWLLLAVAFALKAARAPTQAGSHD